MEVPAMRKLVLLSLLVSLVAVLAPASVGATPFGGETNPIGSLRWLPDNANEKGQVGANQFRLAVVYDYSLDTQGKPIAPLLAKGAFGVKFYTTSAADLRMVEHSESVISLGDVGGDPVGPVDEVFMGVAGDVRDSSCPQAGVSPASAAYSTTRTFFHAGSSPYQPVTGPGACEVVDATTPVSGGFNTTVTTHVPGFWIDVTWPTRTVPAAGTGRLMADVWYGALYDTEGEEGDFYETADAEGDSKSVGSPGEYDATFSFSGTPGAVGEPCPGFPGQTDAPAGTFQEVKVSVPADATKVTFKLFPKGDWDLRVVDPSGNVGDSGAFGGLDETEVVPSNGNGNIPELVPGEFTMRACNYTGEPATFGAVNIE
jgi:hypothetical protein